MKKNLLKMIFITALSLMVLMTSVTALAAKGDQKDDNVKPGQNNISISGEATEDGILISISAGNIDLTDAEIEITNSNDKKIDASDLSKKSGGKWQLTAYATESGKYTVTITPKNGDAVTKTLTLDFSSFAFDLISSEGKLVYSDGKLIISGFKASSKATITASLNGGSFTSFDADTYSINVKKADIGDEYELEILAENDDDEETVTLTYTIALADYVDIHELEDYYILTVDSDSGISSVSMASDYEKKSGGYYFYEDDETSLTATTALYYSLKSVDINYGSASISGSTISVDFSESRYGVDEVYVLEINTSYVTISETAPTQYYTIRVYAGTGGTVSPSGTVQIAEGGDQTLYIAANDGYKISSVTVDGVEVGAVSSYSFVTVVSDHTVIASFALDSASGESGSETPSGTTPSTPTIPSTGAEIMVIPAVISLAAGLALLRKRK